MGEIFRLKELNMKRVIAFLLLCVFTLTAVLTGCGDGKDNVTDSPDSSSGAEETSINVGISQDLDDSLDPHHVTSAGTREVLFNIFEGLVKVASDGSIVPAVAESYDFSDGGLTLTFNLRSGVKFHNGDEVTAEDVVYSLKRCAGMLDEDILVSAFSVITDISATDDSTVTVTMSECNIEIISYFATSDVAIIPEDYADQATAPIGTGPFKFVSRSPQESVVIERFDDYWGDKAQIQTVNYKIISDADSLLLSLKSGAIDLCAHLTPEQAAEVEGDFDVYEDTMKLVQALYLNNSFEPFSDVRVRQALCYAINVQEVIDFVCDGEGIQCGSAMFPAFSKYYMEELNDTYTYDPDKAKELLAEAGYSDLSFTITVPSNYQQHVDAATVIVEQLKAVGVTVTINTVEWATWVSDVYTGREYEATVVGVDTSALTARGMLERYTSESSKNFVNFSDAEYDELFTQAVTETDDDAQTAIYKQMETILSEQAASVYIEDLCDLVAVNPELGGLTFYPSYVLDLSTVYYK
jgi:peptide/nickel transport system substrate-binding protein